MPFLAGVQSNVSDGVLLISSEYSVNSTSLHFSNITVNLLCLYINICLILQLFSLTLFFLSVGKPWVLMKNMLANVAQLSCSLSKFIALAETACQPIPVPVLRVP